MDQNQPCGQDPVETARNCDRYEKGLELAEAGKHEEALEYMQEQLRATPDDAEVLNDTGAILHCLGRSDEAIDHIVKARSIQHDSAEIVWNLAEAYLAIGRAGEAMRLFDNMHQIGVLNADVLNRTADIFLNQPTPSRCCCARCKSGPTRRYCSRWWK
jgi:Flp pilus assembly protein TadD